MAIKRHVDYKKNRVRKNIHNYFYDNLLYTQLIYSYLILFFIDRRQAGNVLPKARLQQMQEALSEFLLMEVISEAGEYYFPYASL
jgi:hypothetical protein